MGEISVLLFLGFLEAGKTRFTQETLEDKRMNTGERTLLLVCEEGLEEYEPDRFEAGHVVKVTLDDVKELTMENLTALTEKHKISRVIVEYNGTWLLSQFFEAMPENWVIDQIMTFFDSATFGLFNQNMRQLVFDKIQMAQLVVFNRFKDEYSKEEFHKTIRGVSRRTEIIYEYEDGKTERDDIEDPLPFDVNAPVIEVSDRDFAWFYSDMAENAEEYIGKTVKFKGMAAVVKKLPKGFIILGRHIMTCCEADIAYDGFAVDTRGLLENIETRDWLTVTAKITFAKCAAYRGEGPVLVAEKLERSDPPEEQVATYY